MSIQKDVEAIGHAFKAAAHRFVALAEKLFGHDFVHREEALAKTILATALGKIIHTSILEAQALAAGTDKRAHALAVIATAAKAAGIEAKDQAVNEGLEVVLGFLKRGGQV